VGASIFRNGKNLKGMKKNDRIKVAVRIRPFISFYTANVRRLDKYYYNIDLLIH